MNLGMQIPESFIMFAGPPSCGRHSAIGSFQKDNKHRNSYLFLSDEDISLGTVEDEIYSAVDSILSDIRKRPRVFIILFACALFIEGIDERAVISHLSEKYSDITFQVCLMNPISIGTDHAPVTMMYSRMAELYDKSQQENSLNFLGNNIPVDHDSEIYDVLSKLGVRKVNHASELKDFDSFRTMGHARWNLVIKPEGIRAAKELSPRMDYRVLLTSYEFEEIESQYEQIFDMLGGRVDLSDYKRKAEESIKNTSVRLKGKTIALGSSASYKVFGLARMMVKNGFDITDIFSSRDIYPDVPPFDKEAYDWIVENTDIRLHNTADPKMLGKIRSVCKADVAIGFNAAYFTDTDCIVEAVNDEGMFGYYGINLMMKRIDDALDDPKDLKRLVERYGLVI